MFKFGGNTVNEIKLPHSDPGQRIQFPNGFFAICLSDLMVAGIPSLIGRKSGLNIIFALEFSKARYQVSVLT